MSSWPKVIRDPIHSIIPFDDNRCDRLLLSLINAREFQRLRRIKQLGFSQLTFPGADHSRFAHSIGVMHLARRILARLQAVCNTLIEDEDQKTIVLVAALLHDLGHGPFSHAFESITNDKHEARTLKIITDESTEINRILRDHSPALPEQISYFFDEDADSSAAINPILTQIVSSQLDADRFDYLLRDSFSTGSESGKYDLEWLLQHLEVDIQRKRMYLQSKAMLAAESYMFARYSMYRSVYYHKTTRSGEVMMKMLLTRYRNLIGACDSDEKRKAVVLDGPPAVRRAFTGTIALSDYLMLDDHSITEFAKACTTATDSILQKLSIALLDRKLFKAVDVSEVGPHKVARFYEKAKEIATHTTGLPEEFCFCVDTPSDTAYKLYNPDAEKPATQIYIGSADGGQRELTQASENVRNLTKTYTLTRYYFPEAARDRILSDAVPLLN